MTVRIVTDSTSDLPQELIQEYGITVVPAYVVFNGKTYRDGVDISQDELYQKMVADNISITTSQPPPGDFASVYKKLMAEADKIISIQVTSKLSGIYNSALQAKNMVNGENRIEVVDSCSTSMGLGLITLAAARLAKAGDGLPRIMDEIKTSIPNTHLWGLFDTLKYLLLGGRIGKAKALLGGMLHVKPMLTMCEGELHPNGLARTRSKGMERLVENVKSCLNIQDLAIVHSTTPEDAQTLKDRISAIFDKSAIHISRLGPALGVHGGPGTLIIALREKITDLKQETGEGEKTKRIITLPSLSSIHLPKIKFATL
jgi:DegV family protein with EDD domain